MYNIPSCPLHYYYVIFPILKVAHFFNKRKLKETGFHSPVRGFNLSPSPPYTALHSRINLPRLSGQTVQLSRAVNPWLARHTIHNYFIRIPINNQYIHADFQLHAYKASHVRNCSVNSVFHQPSNGHINPPLSKQRLQTLYYIRKFINLPYRIGRISESCKSFSRLLQGTYESCYWLDVIKWPWLMKVKDRLKTWNNDEHAMMRIWMNPFYKKKTKLALREYTK